MDKEKPEWVPNQSLTEYLGLRDVMIASIESDDNEVPVATTYKAILTFNSVMQVNHLELDRAYNPEEVKKTVVAYMRPALLHTMFEYLVEHDAADLGALLAQTRDETIREMVSRNPAVFPP